MLYRMNRIRETPLYKELQNSDEVEDNEESPTQTKERVKHSYPPTRYIKEQKHEDK